MKCSVIALLLAMPALFTTSIMAQENITEKQELKKPTLEDLIPGGKPTATLKTYMACNGGETRASSPASIP